MYLEVICFPACSEAFLCCSDHRDGLQSEPALHLLLGGHLVLQRQNKGEAVNMSNLVAVWEVAGHLVRCRGERLMVGNWAPQLF